MSSSISMGAVAEATASGAHPLDDWVGTVTVLAQAGLACARQPLPPYQRTVRAGVALNAALDGRLVLSGDTQALVATGQAGRFSLRAAPGTPPMAGELHLQQEGDHLLGQWRESDGAQQAPNSCAWTRANVVLYPLAFQSQATGSLAAQVLQAFELAAEAEALARAQSAPPAPSTPSNLSAPPADAAASAALSKLLAVAQRLDALSAEDLALARLVHRQVTLSRLLGLSAQAGAFAEIASSLHRRLALRHPDEAAEALATQAQWWRSQRQRSQASLLYEEALSLLHAAQRGNSAMAASVQTDLGTLRLRERRLPDAASAFSEALRIDAARKAPVLDLAASMNNLAFVLNEQGNKGRARQLWQQALALLDINAAEHQDMVQLLQDQLREPLQTQPRQAALPHGGAEQT